MTDAQRFNVNHAAAGGATGGQFTSAGSGGGGSSKPASGHGAGHGATAHGHAASKPSGPAGTMSFDAKANKGTGYGTPHGDPHVKSLQTTLNRLGLVDLQGRKLAVDGKLGPLTTQVIKAAQRRLGEKADGQVTPAFLAQLAALKSMPAAHPAAHKTAPHQAVHPHKATPHTGTPKAPVGTNHPVHTPKPSSIRASVLRAESPMPHPGIAEEGHEYWVHGPGAAEIGWGSPGDFDRCTALLEEHAKFSPEQAHGYCNLAHHAALGFYPATHAAMDRGHRARTLEEVALVAEIVRAEMPTADINDLPDDAFAYIEPGGAKDAEGKTTPRDLRHFPVHDAAHVRNALARAPQSPFGDKAMPKIHAAAKRLGVDVADDAQRAIQWPAVITRSFLLSDVDIRRGRVTCESCGQDATGRMVDHYVAPFGEQTEVNDTHGHYIEEIDPTAFNKRLADLSRSSNGVRGVGVFYNHAQNLYGTPSDQWSVPVGHPAVLRADGRGLFGSTHYSTDPDSDRIRQGVVDGNIAGHSFTGRIVRSNPDRVPRRARSGDLPVVRRLELGLSEYGPTPLPYYAGTPVVAVRAQLSGQHSGMEPLATTPPLPSGVGSEEPLLALRSAEELRRRIRRALIVRSGQHGQADQASGDRHPS